MSDILERLKDALTAEYTVEHAAWERAQ